VQYDADGDLLYNANGDRLRTDLGQEMYCARCRCYLRPTGKRVPYGSDDVIVWVDECQHCEERRLEREAKDRRARRSEMMLRCELAGCSEWFTPKVTHQRFCSPEHRWAAARRRAKTTA
jgi:hypothetical protein